MTRHKQLQSDEWRRFKDAAAGWLLLPMIIIAVAVFVLTVI